MITCLGWMMTMNPIYEIGFHVFKGKEAILSALFNTAKTKLTTFTDQSRNKFGVNHETFIY